MKSCIDCKHFTDGHYSKTYISPTCTQRGQDSAAYMRQYVCGIDDAKLWEPKDEIDPQARPASVAEQPG